MCIYHFFRIVCLESRSRSRQSGPLLLWSCRQSQGFQPPSFWLRCTDPLSPGAPPCTPSPDSCPGTAPSLDFCQGRALFQAPFLGRVPSLADVVAEVAWVHGRPNPLRKKKYLGEHSGFTSDFFCFRWKISFCTAGSRIHWRAYVTGYSKPNLAKYEIRDRQVPIKQKTSSSMITDRNNSIISYRDTIFYQNWYF